MTLSSTLTYDQTPWHRPGIDELGGGSQENVTPPRDPRTVPHVDAVNQLTRQEVALASLIPSVRMQVEFPGGVPTITQLVALCSTLTAADFRLSDNGDGDTTIQLAQIQGETLRPLELTIVGDVEVDRQRASPVSNGWRVKTKLGDDGVDAPFVLALHAPVHPLQDLPYRAGSHLVWVAQFFIDLKVYGFNTAQAAEDPTAHPVTLTLPDPEPSNPNPVKVSSVGFAPNGDMWVGYSNSINENVNQGRYMSKVSASKLGVSGPVTPDFSFQLPGAGVGSSGVSAIAFTPFGDMWLSTIALTTASAGIIKYSAASIASPGSPSPAVVLAQPFPPVPDNPQHTNAANDLFFDGAGNLWFTNALASTVNRLSAAQLLATNTAIVPDIVLSTAVSYTGCALDASGNLWCARAGRIDMFAAAQILASGSPPVARTINTPAGAAKVRFDNAGNLWTLTPTGLVSYTPFDISVSGTPTPRFTLTGGGEITAGRMFAFDPASFV